MAVQHGEPFLESPGNRFLKPLCILLSIRSSTHIAKQLALPQATIPPRLPHPSCHSSSLQNTSISSMSHVVAASPTCSGCGWERRAAGAAAGQRQHPARAVHHRRPCQRPAVVRAAAVDDVEAWIDGSSGALAAAKQRLLAVLAGTERGSEARSLRRGEVEEAQVQALLLVRRA